MTPRRPLGSPDLVLPFPHQQSFRYVITPPAGFAPGAVPESSQKRIGPATLARKFETDLKGVVTATLSLDTGRRQWTPAEVAEGHAALRAVAGEPMFVVRFEQVGEAHLAARADQGGAGRVPAARRCVAAVGGATGAGVARAHRGRAGRGGPGAGGARDRTRSRVEPGAFRARVGAAARRRRPAVRQGLGPRGRNLGDAEGHRRSARATPTCARTWPSCSSSMRMASGTRQAASSTRRSASTARSGTNSTSATTTPTC